MPELPQVETIRRELDSALHGKKIHKAKVYWAKTVAPLSVSKFEKEIIGLSIEKVERQAKILIIDLAGPYSLAFHLKMTGQLIYKPKTGTIMVGGHPAPEDEKHLPNNHTRLEITFSDDSVLFFNDLRKFGWARLINDSEKTLLTKNIGIEPLSKNFNKEIVIDIFRHYPNRTVKQILMDQALIAGIGNIYADESAFLAKLMPNRKAITLSDTDLALLHKSIVEVLKLAIKKKGTSSRNYRRSDGSEGGFVPFLYVYGRENKPCKICGTKIEKIRHNGRGTHYCPICQK